MGFLHIDILEQTLNSTFGERPKLAWNSEKNVGWKLGERAKLAVHLKKEPISLSICIWSQFSKNSGIFLEVTPQTPPLPPPEVCKSPIWETFLYFSMLQSGHFWREESSKRGDCYNFWVAVKVVKNKNKICTNENFQQQKNPAYGRHQLSLEIMYVKVTLKKYCRR